MKKIGLFLAVVVVLTACVTINVYFPEAKAREAAQQTITEIMGKDSPASSQPAPDSSLLDLRQHGLHLLAETLDLLVPVAHATSPGEENIKRGMQLRFTELEPFLVSGAVGFTHDGFLAIKDLNIAPARERAKVRSLVDADNADRRALYQESARALGNPQWESRQQAIYAEEWIKQAKARGFWHQLSDGNWTK